MRSQSRRFALGTVAVAVVLSFGLATAEAQGVPGYSVNKCLAGKTVCVRNKIAGLLKCRERCQKDPRKCGAVQGRCEAKVIARFEGDRSRPVTSCFGKLEARQDPTKPKTICTTTWDLAAMEAKVDACVALVVSELEGLLDSTPTPTDTPAPTPTVTSTASETPTPTPSVTPTPWSWVVDNGDGTVTDNQTGLQWEKKTTVWGSGQNYADPHDVDNYYTWTDISDGDYTDPDGTAFTDFLVKLNTPPCFAGHCDWRLPKSGGRPDWGIGEPAELESILLAPYPCGTSPSIDPIFGPTAAFTYWSATTIAVNPALAWYVDFFSGGVGFGNKDFDRYVRAVRAGL